MLQCIASYVLTFDIILISYKTLDAAMLAIPCSYNYYLQCNNTVPTQTYCDRIINDNCSTPQLSRNDGITQLHGSYMVMKDQIAMCTILFMLKWLNSSSLV